MHAPKRGNHAFPPSFTYVVFKEWSCKGIASTKDLYINKQFCSFEQLQIKYALPKTHFFQFSQLRNYIWQNIPTFQSLPVENALYQILLGAPEAKSLISVLVKLFLHNIAQPAMNIKQKWEN